MNRRLWLLIVFIFATFVIPRITISNTAEGFSEVWKTDFSKKSVNLDEIISGGPARDGIPPVDNPVFTNISQADEWIKDREPIIVISIGKTSRAYPIQILMWHEIVNDEIESVPVAITFCPLCYTAITFQRPVIKEETLSFGTSGMLRNSDLVMWDRQTESWWQQFSGEAIVGELTGTKLKMLPSSLISWKDVKADYSEALVLSKETGHQRQYGKNPYEGYDNINNTPFLLNKPVSKSHPPMERIVGVVDAAEKSYFLLKDLKKKSVINKKLGKKRIVLFWKPGTASALDSYQIAEGQDIGSTSVFIAETQKYKLKFKAKQNGLFIDTKTRSTWNTSGLAIKGKLKGAQLQRIVHHDTFWFVWSVFIGSK